MDTTSLAIREEINIEWGDVEVGVLQTGRLLGLENLEKCTPKVGITALELYLSSFFKPRPPTTKPLPFVSIDCPSAVGHFHH